MKTLIAVLLLILVGTVACEESKTIALSSSEKSQALTLVDKRRDIQLRRLQADLRHQQEINRLAEEETQINITYDQLCYSIRKAHSISYKAQYVMNEFKGVMERQ